jgi:hypothetical protein
MEKNFGNKLVVRETKKSKIILIRIGAIATLLITSSAGLFFLLNPTEPMDTIMGFVALGSAVFLCAVLFIVSVNIRSTVEIYEEGVIVKKRKGEHSFHFSEIAGLRDIYDGSSTYVVSGGVLGAVITGMAAGVAGSIADAHRSKNRIRSICIVPVASGSREVGVLNTAGDELSEVYTNWLVKQKSVTKENINSLVFSFGETLELNHGIFIHRRRNGEVQLALTDITNLEIRADSLMFFGQN